MQVCLAGSASGVLEDEPFLLRCGVTLGDRQLGGSQFGIVDAVPVAGRILSVGARVVGMSLLVVGVVRGQAAAKTAVGTKKEQQHPGDEAEDHIRKSESQEVELSVQY